MGLVKQIEVDSIIEENAYNDAFVQVDAIKATKTKLPQKFQSTSMIKGGVKKKSVTVKVGDDLYINSLMKEKFMQMAYIIEEIDAVNQCISISNGKPIVQRRQSRRVDRRK